MSSGTFGSCSGLASSVVGCCVCELARLLLAVRKLGKLVERGASSRIRPSVSAKDFNTFYYDVLSWITKFVEKGWNFVAERAIPLSVIEQSQIMKIKMIFLDLQILFVQLSPVNWQNVTTKKLLNKIFNIIPFTVVNCSFLLQFTGYFFGTFLKQNRIGI